MDNDEIPAVQAPDPYPEKAQPTTQRLDEFLLGLGALVSELRQRWRISENGALKLLNTGLEYNLNRLSLKFQYENQQAAEETIVGEPAK